MRKPLGNSGQALLMTVGIAALMVIAFALMLFITSTNARQQSTGSLEMAGRDIAQEGIVYASEQLSSSTTTWQHALAGNFNGTDCNGGELATPANNFFKIYCSTSSAQNTNPLLQPYQVAVTAVALKPGTPGHRQPLRALKAYLSRRTLGADISSGIGLHAAAALQLMGLPPTLSANSLNVHWGPIVCFGVTNSNALSWTLTNPIDASLYPRKFSVGGITGSSPNTRSGSLGGSYATDQKEYWANAPLAIPPNIDEASYLAQASVTDITTPPTSLVNGTGTPIPRAVGACAAGHASCAIFQPNAGDTAVFDGTGLGYSAPSGAVIYVMGNAQFNKTNIGLGTFIITKNLAITDASGGSSNPNLHVPANARLEYVNSIITEPCKTYEGLLSSGSPVYDCAASNVFPSPFNVPFKGFLYVKGTMMVSAQNWNMVGALLVGDMQGSPGTNGQLTFSGSGSLNLAYDDIVNHQILTAPVSGTRLAVAPDFVQDVPAF